MNTHDTIEDLASKFLTAVWELAERQLGGELQRKVRSDWWVADHDDPRQMHSATESQEVLATSRVLDVYNNQLVGSEFPQQDALREALLKAGVSVEKHQRDFLVPLIIHWCELVDPSHPPEIPQSVLTDFATAVIDGKVESRCIDAVSSLWLAAGDVELKDGIKIRPINDGELRKFGRETLRPAWNPDPLTIPADNWTVLEIEISHSIDNVARQIPTIRSAILAALILSGLVNFRFISLGMTHPYGIFGTSREFPGGMSSQIFGNPPWDTSFVDIKTAAKLKEIWPHLMRILESKNHYLRVPIQRLVEGAGRQRLEDAVIDYAIGLEALLLRGLRDELSYRFRLRGATVLTWSGGDKRQAFDDLKDFYDLRSKIVHGEVVRNPALHSA